MECFHGCAIIYFLLIILLFVTAATEDEEEKKLHIDKQHLAMDYSDYFGDWFDYDIFPDTDMDLQYFIAHDTDNNHRLDGLELLKAMNHEMKEEDAEIAEDVPTDKDFKESEDTVDAILSENDLDNDGFLNYEEFKRVSKDYSLNAPEATGEKIVENQDHEKKKKKKVESKKPKNKKS